MCCFTLLLPPLFNALAITCLLFSSCLHILRCNVSSSILCTPHAQHFMQQLVKHWSHGTRVHCTELTLTAFVGSTLAAAPTEVDSSKALVMLSPNWPGGVVYAVPAMPFAKPSAALEARDRATEATPEVHPSSILGHAGPAGMPSDGAGKLSASSRDAPVPAAAQASQVSSFWEVTAGGGTPRAEAATPAASLKPEAVCSANKALITSNVTRYASDCRAYLYVSTVSYLRCTAWFVDREHVALAGHCVANIGAGSYKLFAIDGTYGQVCCSTDPGDSPRDCAADARFAVLQAVTTVGWLSQALEGNDAAVLKVERFDTTDSGFGVPVAWGPMRWTLCDKRALWFGGFPGQGTVSAGCNMPFAGRFLYTSQAAFPVKCTADRNFHVDCEGTCAIANDGSQLGYEGSSCQGMSGGGLVDVSESVPFYYGILTLSYTKCPEAGGRSKTIFVQLVNANTGAGVHLAELVAALP